MGSAPDRPEDCAGRVASALSVARRSRLAYTPVMLSRSTDGAIACGFALLFAGCGGDTTGPPCCGDATGHDATVGDATSNTIVNRDAGADGRTGAAGDTSAGGELSDGGPDGGVPDASPPPDSGTSGWRITAYFTAVDSFFSGPSAALTGCLNVNCNAPGDPANALGTFATAFSDTVMTEGTGKITTGPHAGKYLNWSGGQPGSGYWLDSWPCDAQGSALVPYVSAAAYGTYAFGTAFRVVSCGVDGLSGDPMDTQACADFKAANWVVRDRFEATTERRHIDLYIGQQDRTNMDNNPHFVDQTGASTTLP